MPEQPKAKSAAKPKATAQAKARRTARSRGRRSTLVLLLVGLAFVAVLFAFVYPTRTFLDQRNETNKSRAQLEVLQAENARLARESKRMSTDSEIERLARQKYGLVRPGERPFVILPAPSSTVPPPTSTVPVAP